MGTQSASDVRMKKKKKHKREELDIIFDRYNIVQFYNLSEEEQKGLIKSCVKKIRHPNSRKALERIIYDYQTKGAINRKYKCPKCGGYHLARVKGNDKRLQKVENFIKKAIRKINEQI